MSSRWASGVWIVRVARVACVAAVAICGGCKGKGGQLPEVSLVQVKQQLAEREGKLKSYTLTGTKVQQGLEGKFEFTYRSPHRMKVVLTEPVRRTASFDGKALHELVPDEKKLVTYAMELPPEKSALFLAQIFSEYTPEGYRTPRFVPSASTVERTSHLRAPEAIALTTEAADENGVVARIRYVMRWPALDFLSKTVELKSEDNATSHRLDVVDEHCEAAVGLCFPKRLVQRDGEHVAWTLAFESVRINPSIPQDAFTLELPEGFTRGQRSLVEAEAKAEAGTPP